jgi:hypothetical protein
MQKRTKEMLGTAGAVAGILLIVWPALTPWPMADGAIITIAVTGVVVVLVSLVFM